MTSVDIIEIQNGVGMKGHHLKLPKIPSSETMF